MVKFSLPSEYVCWQCGKSFQATADVHATLVEWRCEHCDALNPIIIANDGGLDIGPKMYYAATTLAKDGDYDLASVLLITAIDATLGEGILRLTNWRRTEKLLAPPDTDEMERRLASMNRKRQVQEFEDLAGATMQQEILRLQAEGRIPPSLDLSAEKICNGFDMIRTARNRLVHLGKPVKSETVVENQPMIAWAIIILESLYEAAFSLRKDRPGTEGDGRVLRKWRTWLRAIADDVTELRARIHIYEELAKIVAANDEIPAV